MMRALAQGCSHSVLFPSLLVQRSGVNTWTGVKPASKVKFPLNDTSELTKQKETHRLMVASGKGELGSLGLSRTHCYILNG